MLYLGGAAWIVLAALESSVATAAALLVMFGAAVDGVLLARREHLVPGALGVVTRVAIGLYAGWVTAAFFLNVATALVESGLVEADELSWQLVVLVVAVATLVALTIAARGVLAYAAAGCWALAGISVTGASGGTTAVTVFAVVSAALLMGLASVLRLKDPDLGASTA